MDNCSRLDLSWIEVVSRQHAGVLRVYVFGSQARGDARGTSDIDLGVEAKSYSDFARWADDLEANAPTLKKLDLVYLPETSQALKDKVRDEGKLIYERSSASTKS